jgi:REP element-mobilizing transposase RayT
MPNTYSQITIQIVFAVKGRENILNASIRPELFKYVSGIISNKGQVPLAVNGWKDHVHALFGLSPNVSVSEMARDIKANTSKWINENQLIKGKFSWQEGFGAFSYSRSQRDDVIKYIINQEHHHAVKTFKEEYLDMLKKSEIDFEEKYLFDFYD